MARASVRGSAAPPCLFCGKPLRSFYTYPNMGPTGMGEKEWKGFGYRGKGYFCSMTCGWRWALAVMARAEKKLAAARKEEES